MIFNNWLLFWNFYICVYYSYFPKILSHPVIPLRKPTLFQHNGEHSSLTSKSLNKLKVRKLLGEKTGQVISKSISNMLNLELHVQKYNKSKKICSVNEYIEKKLKFSSEEATDISIQ